MIFDDLEKQGYGKYLENNPFHKVLNFDLGHYGLLTEAKLSNKIEIDLWEPVDPNITTVKPPELDDLIRLHFLITSRKVTTILEFGVGMSTAVFDHALTVNKNLYGEYVSTNLRRSNPFECHSVDDSHHWINETQKRYKFQNSVFHFSECKMSTFNGRICTLYEEVPNICPDFIYLDGPDQFSVIGDVRGISTRHSDRVPMAADLLAMEHFLLPGTIIVVDGRTSNARFLKSNFQRTWQYSHYKEYDQHVFELTEEPLGKINAKHQIFVSNDINF